MYQGREQIFNAREEVLSAAASRRCQLRSVVRTCLCAWMVALVPHGSAFGQAPSMEQSGYDAQIGPDRPCTIYPCQDNRASLEFPRFVSNRLTASETVTLHELSHHVPGRAVKEYQRAVKAANEGDLENAVAHYHKAIAADPEFLPAINSLGVTYTGLEQSGGSD